MVGKTLLVMSLISLTVFSGIGPWFQGLADFFGTFLATSGVPTNCNPADSTVTATGSVVGDKCTQYSGRSPSNIPNTVGADPVPDLSLPKTVVSSIDDLIGAGGVIDRSPDNLTIYNSQLMLRLLGGHEPHDQLVYPSGMASSTIFWSVEASVGSTWKPLVPFSSNCTVIGTNRTGTFAVRTMQVGAGTYSGILKVFYRATSAGPLNWDVQFVANSTDQYRLVYTWTNITQKHDFLFITKELRLLSGLTSVRLSWTDIPQRFNATPTLTASRFQLSMDLGLLSAGTAVSLDPSLVSSNASQQGTADTFQRHILYDPSAGNYWAFYANAIPSGRLNVTYRYSHDGLNWSTPQQMPPGWPIGLGTSSPTVINAGPNVFLAAGSLGGATSGTSAAAVYYSTGTISGSAINWGSTVQASYFSQNCGPNLCALSVRDVSLALSSAGQPVFSFNLYGLNCLGSCKLISNLYVTYGNRILLVDNDSNPYTPDNSQNDGNPDIMYSAVAASDSQGGAVAVYEKYVFLANVWTKQLRSVWFNSNTNGTSQLLDPTVSDSGQFSMLSDSSYGVHLLYRTMAYGTVNYAYHSPSGSSWAIPASDIFSGNVTFPTLTADYSTGYLYAIALKGAYIAMKQKTANGLWSDSSTSFPIAGRISPAYLGSNYASASTGNFTKVLLLWTEGNSPYNITFASIPIQTVWSPYASPPDPWDNYGIVPYGQYFANLGEYVSPSTGMLTVKQTDLSVPGRGLNLEITRIYTEPLSFLGGAPLNYESYPWAPMGRGWQLNFPWLNNTAHPLYIHLWDGDGYRIPSAFWSGSTATFENHDGESFRLIRNADGTIDLYDKSGTTYFFGSSPNHGLLSITDAVGNSINLVYNGNLISCISDTVGRAFSLSYINGPPQTLGAVNQMTGGCSSLGTTVRSIQYGIQFVGLAPDLVSVTDPASRVTSYYYSAVPSNSAIDPWILSQIKYPTSWLTNYTYAGVQLGTQTNSFRVRTQLTGSSFTSPVRQFTYTYSTGVGDQITNSVVTEYNGTRIAGYTRYSFSFIADIKNVTDANGNLLSGTEQFFSVNGQIPKEVVLVSDGQGNIGSYTNYYSYDLWGNEIYSRRTINSSTKSSHETFSAYYNNGLAPGFYALEDTFSRNQGTSPDNSWSIVNGNWLVNNGVFNATPTAGAEESVVAFSSINKADVSVQASILLSNWVNQTADHRFGIFTHYSGGSLFRKWAVVIHGVGSSAYLELVDEWNGWLGNQGQPGGQSTAVSMCPAWTIPLISTGVWYTFNMTVRGTSATAWAKIPGQPQCIVSGSYSSTSPAISGTGFGLYAGTYSSLFDNVTVSTVDQFITGVGFSNSFYQNGAPSGNIHGALAGIAELMNGTGSEPIEEYYAYTASGRPSQTKSRYDSSSTQWFTTSRSYDPYGNLVRLIDPRGNATSYAYSGRYASAYLTVENQTLIPRATPIVASFGYNFADGTLIWAQQPDGYGSKSYNTTHSYDILGRTTRTTYPTGDYESYVYSDLGNYVNITNENGWLTKQVYDGLGRLGSVQRFLNGAIYSSEAYGYNWLDEKTTTIDPLGNKSIFSYYGQGRLNATINPDGNFTQIFYNDFASYVRSVDEYGSNQCSIYDRLGRLVSVIEAADTLCQTGIVTNYSYDEVGDLVSVTKANRATTLYAYDNQRRLTLTSYPDATGESYTYDASGNPVSETNRMNVRSDYSYDSMNRLQKFTTTGTPAIKDSYSYDNNGNLLYLQSPNTTTVYGYDSRNRVINETYIVNGNFTLSIDPNSASFTCTYTSCSPTSANATLTITSLNGFASFVFLNYVPPSSGSGGTDLTGPAMVLLGPGSVVHKTVTAYMGTKSGNYAWSIQGNYAGFTASTTFTISEYNCSRPPCPSFPTSGSSPSSPSSPLAPSMSGASYTVKYAYAGEVLANITYPDNRIVKYGYDGLGRVSTVSTPQLVTYASFTYSPSDQISSITYGNGLVASYTYDSDSRVRNIALAQPGKKGNTLLTLAYQYNKTGTVASISGLNSAYTGMGALMSVVYEATAYDGLHRLVSSFSQDQGIMSSTSYSYDTVGNRLSQTFMGTGSTTTAYSYNSTNDELTKSTIQGSQAGTSYSYDRAGDLLTRNVTSTSGAVTHWRYTWDASGDLLSLNNDTGTQGIYAYDGMGRLVESVEASTTSFFAYLGTETLYSQIKGGAVTDYVFAGGVRIAKISGSINVGYYQADALGSVRMVTDSNANIQFGDDYQPFGQDSYGPAPPGNETYRFTGKPISQTTGLYYDYWRWYDPGIGRFISHDPLNGIASNPASTNPYVYVENVPTTRIDPTGAADCYGSSLCQGPGYGVWTSSDVENYLKAHDITDSTLRNQCFQNPRMCPMFLRTAGYDPDELISDTTGLTDVTTTAADTVKTTVSDTSTLTIYPNPTTSSEANVGSSRLTSNQLGDLAEGGTLGKLARLGVNPEAEVDYEPGFKMPNGQTKYPDFRVSESKVGFRGIIETKWTLSDTDSRAVLQLEVNVQISRMTGLPLYYDVYSPIGPFFEDLFKLYGVNIL